MIQSVTQSSVQMQVQKQLSLILPNTNKALNQVLQDLSTTQMQSVTQAKDLKSILNSLLKESAGNTPTQDKNLLELVKSNPTLQNLATPGKTLQELDKLLSKVIQQETKIPNEIKNTQTQVKTQIQEQTKPTLLKLQKTLQEFTAPLKNIQHQELKTSLSNSGVFLESKLKNILQNSLTQETTTLIRKAHTLNKPEPLQNATHSKERLSQDLKALLLQSHEEINNSNAPHKQELLKTIDKLTLQIDYHQLVSHLSNASSLYIPYSWEALEDGTITLKSAKEDKFFCDIELKLKEYGAIKLRLGMFEKNQLNINISTENETFKNLLKENISTLKKQLFSIGINPQSIRFLDDSSNKTDAYTTPTKNLDMGFEIKA